MNLRMMLANRMRDIGLMFPGFYPGNFGGTKHPHYADFGYPAEVTFDLAFHAYTRIGLGRAGVDKTVDTTWQDAPWLQEFARDDGDDRPETPVEKAIRERFADLRVWQNLATADRRGMVGRYAGVILRLADNKRLDQPVGRVPGGLRGLVEIIPAWEGQLTVSQWDTNETSEGYGQPKMFQFNEAAVDKATTQPRQFNVHPDRVVIWSETGTVHGSSALEPGYNSLLDLEKIRGAGGEGFWKNAKSGLSLEIDKDAKIEEMARANGMNIAEYVDAMDEQVSDFHKGFDKLLMTQGMKVTPLQVTLPSPEHFFAIALQDFAASLSIPLKILVGSQTGERASTEDADEWAATITSRRNDATIPNIMAFVRRLVRFGILKEADWHLDWAGLGEASLTEKVALADKMADVNQKMKDTGEYVFTTDEMRGVTGKEPLTDAEKYREPLDDDDEGAALGPDATEDAPAEDA